VYLNTSPNRFWQSIGENRSSVTAAGGDKEEDETHLIETTLETRLVTRACGQALNPEREPLDMLEQIRSTIGE
jgi:hypothetical protein